MIKLSTGKEFLKADKLFRISANKKITERKKEETTDNLIAISGRGEMVIESKVLKLTQNTYNA